MVRHCNRSMGPLILWAAFFLLGSSSFAQQCDPNGQSGGCCLSTGNYAPAGYPCNDGNPRTVDSCNATGVCVGVYPQGPVCAATATYNQQTGACVANNRPNPTCGDGNVDSGEECDNGSKCSNGTDCTGNPGACSDGSCRPVAGNCCTASCVFANAGTACDDGNGCTPTDTCDGNGTCVGSGEVNCDGSDACHPTNFCSPATGSCSTCGDPNNVQDQSYCSLETEQCVSKIQPCPQYEIDASGNENLCRTNYAQDPKTGECLYQPKLCAPIPGDCNRQACDPGTGQCVEQPDPSCIGACTEPTFPNRPCLTGKCEADGCLFDPNQTPNCFLAEYPDCADNANACEVSQGCDETNGCNYVAVACDVPANPCQEVVRTPEASTCCTYQPRNCASEFGNDPNYIYSCDPTPGTGGCRAFIPQTITFNSPGAQFVGSTVNLVASASSNLAVTFTSLTTTVCTVSGSVANLLTTGTCTIQATQPGSAPQPGKTPYAAASPVNVSFPVQPQHQTITFNPIPQQIVGATVQLSASASSGLPVAFTSLTLAICSVNGSMANMLAPGTCTIQANQSGGSGYPPAQPVTQSITVIQATQTITFTKFPASQLQGTSLTLSAQATSNLPVSFTSLTPSICTVSGNVATLAYPGTCTIQASQAGNVVYAAAQPVSQQLTVIAAFTITPNPHSETIYRGDIAAFLLKLQAASGFTGNVKLSCSGGPAGSYCTDFPMTVSFNKKGIALALSGIYFPPSTKPGTYTLTFTGVSGAISNTATATFTVVAKP